MQSILIAIDDEMISMRLCEELLEKASSIRAVSDLCILVQRIQKSGCDLILIDEFFAGDRELDVHLEFGEDLLETQVLIWASWIAVIGRAEKRLLTNFHVFKTHTLQELTWEIGRRKKQLDAQLRREKPLARECLSGH